MSNVALKIGGIIHDGWKDVLVNRSMENISGAFQVGITDKWTSALGSEIPPRIKPGQAVEVTIDEEIVITGYIDAVKLSYDGSTHTITINGRDKAGDLVDCSVINGTGEWKGLKLEEIAKRICEPFGIAVKTEVDTGEVIKTFNVEQGMTAFEAIQKLCSLRACLCISDGKGGLLITRASKIKLITPLIEGGNILSAEGNYDFTERFSKYICKGQQQGDDFLSTKASTAPNAVVTDEYIERYRPIIIVADGEVGTSRCETRAKWEASVRRGKSRTFTVTVPGWKMMDDELWLLNRLVVVQSPWLGLLAESLLVAGMNFKLDASGEITELALIPPEAYQILADLKIEKGKKGSGDKGSGENPYIGG